ncbi:MAG TPA: peptidoglycan-binding protein [Caulobacteraceae bacterium]|jgi:localization factor PodJL
MTSGAPWSVKGIDPKTREMAKDLARRSGMTLGEWLSHVIAEDGGDAPAGGASRNGLDRPASENRTPRRGGDDLERVLSSLDSLSVRFEASIQDQADTSARFDRAIADLKADQAKVTERLQAAEQGVGGAAGAGKIETLRALEGALNKVAGHLAAGEGRQREAMVEMRRELGAEMSRAADQVNRRVLEVENRSADAIAQVSAEVTRVATAVEQRLRRADDAQAEALEKLGGEIARITERLSERIAASESRSAQSVEEVGHQVARMADRMHARQERGESELVERMRQSEERTAKLLEEAREAIDRRLLRPEEPVSAAPVLEAPVSPAPVSQAPVAKAPVFGQRLDTWVVKPFGVELPAAEAPQASGLSELWKPEAAALFGEGKTDVEEAAPLMHAEIVEEEGEDAESILEASYHGLTADSEEEPSEHQLYAVHDHGHAHDEVEAQHGFVDDQIYPAGVTAEAGVHAEHDLEAMQAVADAITAEPLGAEEEAHEPQEPPRPATRESIVHAKAAAFAEPITYASEHDRWEPEAREPQEPEADERMAFSDLGARRPSRAAHPMRGVLLAGGAAAFMGLAGTGLVVLHPEITRAPGAPSANPIPVGPPSSPTAAPASAPAPTQQAAVALATTPTPAAKPAGLDLDGLYRDASAKVDNGDASGVAPLRTAANLGYAPAQRRLGKLYEDGGVGVGKDPVEGRRWTLRAAANGDVRAMHNLALDYYQGVGGAKSPAIAAQYFQRAAELGLRDSQFNLARFMEAGIGLQQDLPGAYRWYLIAARAGDTEAQTRAIALKVKLSADQQARAQAMAGAFQPDPAAGPASLTALLQGSNPTQLALAQRALNKLGYYRGPNDGSASQALGEAIQSYQRARGLAANGQLSPELLQTFAHVAQ